MTNFSHKIDRADIHQDIFNDTESVFNELSMLKCIVTFSYVANI